MKKLLSLIMVLTLVLSLAACGSKTEETATTETTTEAADTTKDTATTDTTDSTTTDTAKEDVKIILTNGKGEIATQFEEAAKLFNESHPGMVVEPYSVQVGDTVSIFDKLTSSGEKITLAMFEPNAALADYADWGVDLSGEDWMAETVDAMKNPSGVVVGFPFAIEGMGLVYNKAVVEKAVPGFDPFSITTRDALVELLDALVASGVAKPIAYQTEAWSVGNHFGSMFINQNEDPLVTVNAIAAGTFDFANNAAWNGYLDTMDVLSDAKYNLYGERPIGQYYDQAHIAVGSGEAAMLFNGNWAFDSLKALEGSDFGFIPVPNDNDPNNRLNGKLTAGPTQIFMINKEASEEEIAVAKAFLNWIVFDEAGQDFLVNKSQVISAFKNNPNKVTNPLGGAIADAIAAGKTLPFSTNYVSAGDYYSIVGPEIQKYIDRAASGSTRADLADAYKNYYAEYYAK